MKVIQVATTYVVCLWGGAAFAARSSNAKRQPSIDGASERTSGWRVAGDGDPGKTEGQGRRAQGDTGITGIPNPASLPRPLAPSSRRVVLGVVCSSHNNHRNNSNSNNSLMVIIVVVIVVVVVVEVVVVVVIIV